jgi:hypothetical protein
MTKSEALAIFGGKKTDLALALGVTPALVHHWPEQLDQGVADRVMGAAIRLGKLPPPALRLQVLWALANHLDVPAAAL